MAMNMHKTGDAVPMHDVSVVIPCFCCESTVGRAVDSALAQSMQPLEVILVDDASPQETRRALEALLREHGERLRIITLARNGGAAAARNAAWDAARGEFVALLDADDAWHPRKLEIQLGFMRAHPEFPMSAHQHAFDDRPPGSLGVGKDVRFSEISFRAMLYRNWFHTSSVMMRRDLPHRFAAGKRYGEDRQLWLDVAAGGASRASTCRWCASTSRCTACPASAPTSGRWKRPSSRPFGACIRRA
jgi:glycosyltransferase involved in cell wall biosynthesis